MADTATTTTIGLQNVTEFAQMEDVTGAKVKDMYKCRINGVFVTTRASSEQAVVDAHNNPGTVYVKNKSGNSVMQQLPIDTSFLQGRLVKSVARRLAELDADA